MYRVGEVRTWAEEHGAWLEKHPTDEDRARFAVIVDAINFCFWPSPGFEYEQL